MQCHCKRESLYLNIPVHRQSSTINSWHRHDGGRHQHRQELEQEADDVHLAQERQADVLRRGPELKKKTAKFCTFCILKKIIISLFYKTQGNLVIDKIHKLYKALEPSSTTWSHEEFLSVKTVNKIHDTQRQNFAHSEWGGQTQRTTNDNECQTLLVTLHNP